MHPTATISKDLSAKQKEKDPEQEKPEHNFVCPFLKIMPAVEILYNMYL